MIWVTGFGFEIRKVFFLIWILNVEFWSKFDVLLSFVRISVKFKDWDCGIHSSFSKFIP